jgi:hypothetical protein
MLALQTVILISIDLLCALLDRRLVQRCAAAHSKLVPLKRQYHISRLRMLLYDLLFVLLDLLLVELVKCLQSKLEVGDKRVTARLCEVLAYDDAHQLHLLRVWRHGIGGNDPTALAELMGTVLVLERFHDHCWVTYTANSS